MIDILSCFFIHFLLLILLLLFVFCSVILSCLFYLDVYLSITFETGKVPHVPCSALRLCAFIGQNNFITSAASWFQCFGMMSTAIKSTIAPKIYKINEQLSTNTTNKACRMPQCRGASSTCTHSHFPSRDRPAAFSTPATMGSF